MMLLLTQFLRDLSIQVLYFYNKKKMLIAKLTYQELVSYATICVELINFWKLISNDF